MTINDVRSIQRKRFTAVAVTASMLLLGRVPPMRGTRTGRQLSRSGTPTAAVPAAPAAAPLTNLDHLNFLMDTVPLTPVDGHTTYQLDRTPTAQAPWTYADKKADGSYARVGGGDLDPATGHWTPGRLQRRRYRPHRGGLSASLEADRRRGQQGTRLPDPALADLPADRGRPERRQRCPLAAG